jgi:fructose-1,6-bisphosphatase/sedoheptulose 1,7-bisphosphatase-like protein
MAEVRELGCRIRLIQDGDVSAGIAVCEPESGIDVLLGTGGAPEGVITAAALVCMGGDIQGQLIFQDEQEKARAKKWGIEDFDRIYALSDMVRGDVMFAATGVTTGTFLKGVNFFGNACSTHSIVMRSKSGTVRQIISRHRFDIKPEISGQE